MAIQIIQADFNLIGQLAKHCDLDKLEIAVEEAILFDFAPLLCDLFGDVEENWDDTNDNFYDLINGSKYTGCGGKKRSHIGLKKVLLYYAYARYVVLNNFNDTPNGHVTKTNDFSIPKPLKELEMFADKYRSMGYAAWKGTQAFLCREKDNFPEFKLIDCSACDCGSDDCSDGRVKGYGFKGKNISRWDV